MTTNPLRERPLHSKRRVARSFSMLVLSLSGVIAVVGTNPGNANAAIGEAITVTAPIPANVPSTRATIVPPTIVVAPVAVTFATSVDRGLVDAALAKIRLDWQELMPGWTIAFLPSRPDLLGMTLVRERRVEIYVRPGRGSTGLAHDLGHEFGHVADVLYGSDDSRQDYLRARGLSSETPWWTCRGCRDMQVGAGDFAESFAALVAPPFKFYSTLKKRPSVEALAMIRGALPSDVERLVIEN